MHELKAGLGYANRMAVAMLMVAAILAGGAAALWPAWWTWAAGFALGAAAGIVKFRVFEVGAVLKLWENPAQAMKVQFQAHLLGLALLAGTLLLAFTRRDVFEPVGVAIGFFLPRIVVMLDGYFRPNPFGGVGGPGGEGGDAPPAP